MEWIKENRTEKLTKVSFTQFLGQSLRHLGYAFSTFDCGMRQQRWTHITKFVRAILWPWKMVSVSVPYLFYQPMDEKIKTWPLRFLAKETLIWRRYCSPDQSCCSMTSKRSIGWFLERSRARSIFTLGFA